MVIYLQINWYYDNVYLHTDCCIFLEHSYVVKWVADISIIIPTTSHPCLIYIFILFFVVLLPVLCAHMVSDYTLYTTDRKYIFIFSIFVSNLSIENQMYMYTLLYLFTISYFHYLHRNLHHNISLDDMIFLILTILCIHVSGFCFYLVGKNTKHILSYFKSIFTF